MVFIFKHISIIMHFFFNIGQKEQKFKIQNITLRKWQFMIASDTYNINGWMCTCCSLSAIPCIPLLAIYSYALPNYKIYNLYFPLNSSLYTNIMRKPTLINGFCTYLCLSFKMIKRINLTCPYMINQVKLHWESMSMIQALSAIETRVHSHPDQCHKNYHQR